TVDFRLNARRCERREGVEILSRPRRRLIKYNALDSPSWPGEEVQDADAAVDEREHEIARSRRWPAEGDIGRPNAARQDEFIEIACSGIIDDDVVSVPAQIDVGVAAESAEQQIVPAAAIKHVIACHAAQDIIAVVADQTVRRRVA